MKLKWWWAREDKGESLSCLYLIFAIYLSHRFNAYLPPPRFPLPLTSITTLWGVSGVMGIVLVGDGFCFLGVLFIPLSKSGLVCALDFDFWPAISILVGLLFPFIIVTESKGRVSRDEKERGVLVSTRSEVMFFFHGKLKKLVEKQGTESSSKFGHFRIKRFLRPSGS